MASDWLADQELSNIDSTTTELISDQGTSNSEEAVQFSSSELTLLINKLEDVLAAIKASRQNEHPRPIRRNSWFMKVWAWIVKYFLATTFLWQVVCIALLSIIEVIHKAFGKELSDSLILSTVILAIFQAILIFVVICMSIKITKQYLHMTLTPWFLAQAYLSSILVFTGFYTLYIRLSQKSFKHVDEPHHDAFAFQVYSQMLFFSVSTATLCGVSLTFPNVWYAYITVSVQMLLSFVYFASILSVAINRPRKKRVENTNERTALVTNYGT